MTFARRRRSATPTDACEALEPRTLLTTIIVTDSGDVTDAGDGVLTYREALLAAEAEAGADVITFADGVDLVTLGADLPTVADDFTVAGEGVTVDHAGNAGLGLTGGTFVISGLTFFAADGGDVGGGALRALGGADVTLTDATFTENLASAANGGAVSVTGGATLAMTGGAFADNRAGDFGGAVAVIGEGSAATFAGVTFDGNAATAGGAVFATGGSAVTLTDVRAVRNDARGAAVNRPQLERYQSGGFLAAQEFAFDGEAPARVTVVGGYFALNTAAVDGGVFAVDDSSNRPGAGRDGADTLTVTGATLSSNAAGRNGGAVAFDGTNATFADALFFRNGAGRGGGGLYGRSSALTAVDSTFARNDAGDGGAFRIESNTAASGGDAGEAGTFVNVRFVGNAAARLGGAGYVTGFADPVTVDGGRVAQNTAVRGGGAFTVEDGTLRLSGLSVNRNRVTIEEGAGRLAARGGGAVLVESGELEADGVRMFRNRVTNGDGGAIVAFGRLTLSDVDLTANEADGDGGGLRVSGPGGTLRDTFVRKNDAGGDGGGLHVGQSTTLRLDGGGLLDNVAGGDGGGLWAGGRDFNFGAPGDGRTDVRLYGVRVRGNAATDGGGLRLGDNVRVLLDAGSVARDNAAREAGGAASVGTGADSDVVLRVRDSVVLGNEADRGGAVFTAADAETILLADAVFRGNGPDPFAGPGPVRDRA